VGANELWRLLKELGWQQMNWEVGKGVGVGANELERLVKEFGWEQMNWGGW